MNTKIRVNNQSCTEILLSLGRTGVILEDNVKVYFNIRNGVIKTLIDSQLILKKKVHKPEWRLKNYYSLTTKGHHYIKKELGFKNIYRSSASQLMHDLKLSEIYCLLEKSMRNTWITETELHAQLLDAPTKGLDIRGTIDGAYRDNGALIGVEVITKNYSSNEIQQKHLVANALGCINLLIERI